MSTLSKVQHEKSILRDLIKERHEKKLHLETKVLPPLLSKQKTKKADLEGLRLAIQATNQDFNNLEETRVREVLVQTELESDLLDAELGKVQSDINDLEEAIVYESELRHGYIQLLKVLKNL